MKTFRHARILVVSLAGLVTTAFAQNSAVRWGGDPVPANHGRAVGMIPEESLVFAVQNCRSLETAVPREAESDSMAGQTTFDQPWGVRPAAWQERGSQWLGGDEDGLALLAATYRQQGKSSGGRSCSGVALSVRHKVLSDRDSVLEFVEMEIAANPSCACEIVKSAIQAIGEEIPQVAKIVEVSILAAPEHLRLISQCAVAAAPDALVAIQEVLAKYDPNGGDSGGSSKSAKQGIGNVAQVIKAPAPTNPLDLPPLVVIPPGPIKPPQVTLADP